MAEIRIYFTIRAQTASAPTETQWRNVLQNAAQQSGTLARGIVQAARAAQNFISAEKRSQNAAQLRRYTLAGVEIDDRDVNDLAALLDSLAVARGIAGTRQQKFEGVLQAEIREAAVRAGFSAAQANLISVQIVGFGLREAAMAAAQAYLAANTAIWYE